MYGRTFQGKLSIFILVHKCGDSKLETLHYNLALEIPER